MIVLLIVLTGGLMLPPLLFSTPPWTFYAHLFTALF